MRQTNAYALGALITVVPIVFCLVVGAIAARRGRNGFGWFFISLLITPLIATVVLFVIEDLSKQRCEACGQRIPAEARVCPLCKKDFRYERLSPETEDKLSRGLCPKCDAYNAWIDDTQRGLRKCEVCGEQYPLLV